jgi:hypothetical protein
MTLPLVERLRNFPVGPADMMDAMRDAADALEKAVQLALDESMKAPDSNHPWDRGYRAGAAAVWSKLHALLAASKGDQS